MLQTSAIIFGFILIFVLVSGLVLLWRRGADDLDAWGALCLPGLARRPSVHSETAARP
jgi:hypothetical protein